MPGIFKKLSANDIKITPFEAHKQYDTTDLASIGASTASINWSGQNKSTFTTGSIKYYQIDKLYYRNYIQERAHRLELDDATYTTQERRLYQSASLLSLSQKTFGSEVQPESFTLNITKGGTTYNIADDGFGNLYDTEIGKDNFPNEDNRVFYLAPVNGFKRADLTIDYKTGNEYVNNPFVDGYSRTVHINKDGKVVSLQYGGAWPKIQNDLIALASSGVSVDLIGLVGDKENPVTKKKYMDDPVFATKVRAIQAEIKKAEISHYTTTQSHGQMQFLRTLDLMLAEVPVGATESYYVTVRQQLDKVAATLGVTPDYSKLEDHQKRYSQNALQIKDAMVRYDVYLRSGRLGDHVDKLYLEPPEIRDKYLEIAEKQRELDESKRGYKMVETRLKSMAL